MKKQKYILRGEEMLDNNSNKINLINESTLSNQIADLPEIIQRTGSSGYRYFENHFK